MKKLLLIILFIITLVSSPQAAVYYCDLVDGNDSTGDGSTSTPYKTPDGVADNEVLTGGDEIRIEKSTISALTGTLTFTNGSSSVSTSADLTGTLSSGDLISKNSDTPDGYEHWWLVSSVSSGSITLVGEYFGSSETTTGYYTTPISLDETYWQMTDDGTSLSSRISISGGWNLSNTTREGYTAVTDTSYYGSIRIDSDYTELSYLIATNSAYNSFQLEGFGNYYHHLYGAGNLLQPTIYVTSIQSTLSYIYTNCGDNAGLSIEANSLDTSYLYVFTTDTGGADYGLLIDSSSLIFIDNSYIYNGVSSGIPLRIHDSDSIYITGSTIGYSDGDSVSIEQGTNILFEGCTFTNVGDDAIYLYTLGVANIVRVVSPTFTSVSGSSYSISDASRSFGPTLIIESSNAHYSYFTTDSSDEFTTLGSSGAYFCSDTSEARSGTCIKMASDIATTSPVVNVGTVKVQSTGDDIDLSVYMKDTAGFDGFVYMYAVQNGEVVVTPTIKTLTTSYVNYSITVPAYKLDVNKYLELYVYIAGSTSGNIYIDDFACTQ